MFVSYQNGNYRVLLNLEDGTKIRYNNEDKLIPSRPESIDVKITNQCQHGCVFCHENSNSDGKLATIDAMKNFVNTVPAYTEIAVGGGNLMESYNHTETFLKMLKEVRAIPSITIRQTDFIEYNNIIQKWRKNHLIYGIGISYDGYKDDILFSLLEDFPTAVIHIIAGVFTEYNYQMLRDRNLKILILGYKIRSRGANFWTNNFCQIKTNIANLTKHFKDFEKDFDTVAFDNLALDQLNVKDNISKEKWDAYYLGDDGSYTFYVDLVEEKFAESSSRLFRMDINNRSVEEMFNTVRNPTY